MEHDDTVDPKTYQLFHSVGHDFNNLLTSIVGSISLASDEIADQHPSARRKLAHALLSARRATILARQLLCISDSTRLSLTSGAQDVNELLLRNRLMLETCLPESAVLCYELGPELPSVHADEEDLLGLVVALLSNAGDALRDGEGVVRIRTTAAADAGPAAGAGPEGPRAGGAGGLRLDVVDDGQGIDASVNGRIGDAFFSTKEGRRGLGLYFVRSIIEGLGGSLRIRSDREGTSVSVTIPAGKEDDVSHG